MPGISWVEPVWCVKENSKVVSVAIACAEFSRSIVGEEVGVGVDIGITPASQLAIHIRLSTGVSSQNFEDLRIFII